MEKNMINKPKNRLILQNNLEKGILYYNMSQYFQFSQNIFPFTQHPIEYYPSDKSIPSNDLESPPIQH